MMHIIGLHRTRRERPVCIPDTTGAAPVSPGVRFEMSHRTIIRISIAAGIMIAVASAWCAARAKQERRDLMLALSMSVGADLVHATNSQALIGVTAELQSDIKLIQASPTRAVIQPGDDDPPPGNGRAQARLVLTNEAGQTLTLRLRPESEPGTGLRKFRVLGYRKTEPDGAARAAPPHR
jgi:hypothetical protein